MNKFIQYYISSITALTLCIFLAQNAGASVVDMGLSQSEASITLSTGGSYASSFETEFGYFFSDTEETKMLHLGFSTTSDNDLGVTKPWLIDAGFKLLVIDSMKIGKTIFGMSLGGQFSYQLNLNWVFPVRLSTSLYYAPSITMSSDAKNMYDISIGADLLLNQNAMVYLSMYKILTRWDNFADQTIGKGIKIGMKLRF